jgi:hypothetical protein
VVSGQASIGLASIGSLALHSLIPANIYSHCPSISLFARLLTAQRQMVISTIKRFFTAVSAHGRILSLPQNSRDGFT